MYHHDRLSLSDILTRSRYRYPKKTAVVFGARSWTYQELNEAVSRVAESFHREGITKGDRVIVRGVNSDLFLIAMFACFRLGAIHVPMNVGFVASESLGIVQRTKPALIVTDDETFLADLSNAQKEDSFAWLGQISLMALDKPLLHDGALLGTILAKSGELARNPSNQGASMAVDRDDVAQILFTSGTTSAPKGAMLSHSALSFHYAAAAIALRQQSEDIVLSALPLYHSGQVHGFTGPALMMGATVVIIEKPDPETTLQLIEKFSISSFFAPPTVWISLLNFSGLNRFDLRSLTKIQYGASIMPTPILERLLERFPGVEFYNVFGQTENGPIVSVLGPEGHSVSPGSAGVAVPFVGLRIVDEAFDDVQIGDVGQIVYESPQLFSGYLDDPVATESAFTGRWFKSGDLGRQDENLNIYIVDRVKDVINTGGVLVSSREVEEYIHGMPEVAEVAVVSIPDERWVEAIAAFIVVRSGSELSVNDVLANCRVGLAGFKIPKEVHFIEALPKSGAGKILKRALRAND